MKKIGTLLLPSTQRRVTGMLRRVAILLAALWAPQTAAADWPMYRANPEHTGYTSDRLPTRLYVRWIRKSPAPPLPAWSGRDTRMPFDHAFQPVVAKGLVIWGSSADGCVHAVDAGTGSLKWTFFTDAPVRFAPAVWKDRLFVVSDDGFLYCLTLTDGVLLWKKRGGPNADMLLGNDRLVSRWPARGGPVLKDGVVYFGAGIWPSEGIYLYALDASTGKVIWANDSSGSLVLEQPHSGNRARSGVSIQGYLTIAGDALIVPTGRATPAVFDLKSGQFRYFHLMEQGAGWGKRSGAGPFVTAIDEERFIAEDDVFRVSDGGFVARGLPVSSTAIKPDEIVFSQGHEIRGIGKASLLKTETRKGKSVSTLADVDWRIKCSDPVGATVLRASTSNEAKDWPNATQVVNPPLVVAGNTIVAGTLNSKLVTADRATKELVGTTALDGLAMGFAVADGALMVCTDKGTIYGLAGEPGVVNECSIATDPQPYERIALYEKAAAEMIKRAGFEEGYCVDLGCGDGALAYALAKASGLHIIAIDKDPASVAVAREKLAATGLYGTRVTVICRDSSETELVSEFANLVVSGRSVVEGAQALPAGEARRLLRPYGGVGFAGKPGEMVETQCMPKEAGGAWTHQYADAANTLCSADDLARAPLRMFWFKDFGIQMPSRHGRGPAPLCMNGTMIIEGVDGLFGVDAYNGRILWQYPIKDVLKPYDQEHLLGTAGTGSNMCMADESVYVRQANQCLRIELKTGALIRRYTMPDQTGVWGYIACEKGILYGTSADRTHVVRQLFRNVSDMKDLLTESGSLFALDVKTGEVKWIYKADASIRHNAIAIGNDRIYFMDKPKTLGDLPGKPPKQAGPGVKPQAARLLCLDAKTGKHVWEQNEDVYGTTLALSIKHNVLLMCYQNSPHTFQLPSERGDRLTGFNAVDGKRIWDAKGKYISRPLINDATVYAQPYAYDLLTGTRDAAFQVKERQPGGCAPMSGSTHLLLYRSGTLGYTDLRNNMGTQNYGPVRPGCWLNTIVAGGIVLMPDATDRCTCSYAMKASIALAPYRQERKEK